jgi:hypothetical protein
MLETIERTAMREYSKIETLYERGPDFSVTDVLRSPVVGTISKWLVTEKVDGTNIRVDLRRGDDGIDRVTYGGRTEAAQIPADLIAYLQRAFTVEKMVALRLDADPTTITLFGEGYGPGIQKGGGLYRKDKAVILFDALIGDRWWLDYSDVVEIGAKLDVPVVPMLGVWSLDEMRANVPTLKSTLGERDAEGVVARTIETLYDKHGHRLIIKLKASDFRAGKR